MSEYDFEEVARSSKYAFKAISQKYKESIAMYKNEEIEIRPLQNGYLVEYQYRQINPTNSNPENWDYVEEQYMFATWDEVVAYVQSTPLEVPPSKL